MAADAPHLSLDLLVVVAGLLQPQHCALHTWVRRYTLGCDARHNAAAHNAVAGQRSWREGGVSSVQGQDPRLRRSLCHRLSNMDS